NPQPSWSQSHHKQATVLLAGRISYLGLLHQANTIAPSFIMFFNSIATFSLLVALLSSSVLGAPVPGAFEAELDARESGLLPTKVHPAFSRRPNFHIIKREAEENLVTREPMIAAIHPGLLNRRPIGGGLRYPRLRSGYPTLHPIGFIIAHK
ncbi:hypothetical protein BKA70DRAFT_1468221, partial [Coprinopsis sp. MPI-PUGE-AT-0042]